MVTADKIESESKEKLNEDFTARMDGEESSTASHLALQNEKLNLFDEAIRSKAAELNYKRELILAAIEYLIVAKRQAGELSENNGNEINAAVMSSKMKSFFQSHGILNREDAVKDVFELYEWMECIRNLEVYIGEMKRECNLNSRTLKLMMAQYCFHFDQVINHWNDLDDTLMDNILNDFQKWDQLMDEMDREERARARRSLQEKIMTRRMNFRKQQAEDMAKKRKAAEVPETPGLLELKLRSEDDPELQNIYRDTLRQMYSLEGQLSHIKAVAEAENHD